MYWRLGKPDIHGARYVPRVLSGFDCPSNGSLISVTARTLPLGHVEPDILAL